MPLYFNLDHEDLTFSNDVREALAKIELETRGIAVTPRIALAQIRQQLFPLLQREHNTVIDNLNTPTWDDVLFVFSELVFRSEETDKRLIEVAQAVRLIHSESPRELRRLHYLREWSHEQVEQIFTGNQRASRQAGAGGAQGIPVAMGSG